MFGGTTASIPPGSRTALQSLTSFRFRTGRVSVFRLDGRLGPDTCNLAPGTDVIRVGRPDEQ